MSKISVTFVREDNGQRITLDLDDSITAKEALSSLESAHFIEKPSLGYALLADDKFIPSTQSFSKSKIKSDNMILVVRAKYKTVSRSEIMMSRLTVFILILLIIIVFILIMTI